MPSKGEKLEKFLKDLAKDPGKPGSLYEKYLADPRKVMRDEGIDEDVIVAVMAGNLGFVNDLLHGSNLICATIVFG